jgi:hypothetical protein
MLISFPTIPIPSIPPIPKIPEIVENTGSSGSKSTVIVCVNDKCLTREESSATGSSYLKVTTVANNEEVTTSVENSVTDSKEEGKVLGENIYSKIPISIRDIINKWFAVISKYLTKK